MLAIVRTLAHLYVQFDYLGPQVVLFLVSFDILVTKNVHKIDCLSIDTPVPVGKHFIFIVVVNIRCGAHVYVIAFNINRSMDS